jgi:hypothetical protein
MEYAFTYATVLQNPGCENEMQQEVRRYRQLHLTCLQTFHLDQSVLKPSMINHKPAMKKTSDEIRSPVDCSRLGIDLFLKLLTHFVEY